MTNGDRIRNMKNYELALFLNAIAECCSVGDICEHCPLNSVGIFCDLESFEKWLEKECEEK